MTVLTYFRSKVATVQQEIRDAADFVLHSETLEADACRAILIAACLALAGIVAQYYIPPTPPGTIESACIR